MYIFPEMIDLGLKEGQTFPTEAHREVAQAIGIGNSDVFNRDHLIDIVQKVLTIPNDQIKTLTIEQARKYGLPI